MADMTEEQDLTPRYEDTEAPFIFSDGYRIEEEQQQEEQPRNSDGHRNSPLPFFSDEFLFEEDDQPSLPGDESATGEKDDDYVDIETIIDSDGLKIDRKNRPVLARNAHLRKHGFDPAKCGNTMFKKCSLEWHVIQALSSLRTDEELKSTIAAINAKKGRIPGAGHCVPRLKTIVSRAKLILWSCEDCKDSGGVDMNIHRVFAAVLGPPEDLWKTVIRSETMISKTALFQVSHRCNIYQSYNACSLTEHFSLETVGENMSRKHHHSGDHGCFCDAGCIGPNVVRREYTQKDRVRFGLTMNPTPAAKDDWHPPNVQFPSDPMTTELLLPIADDEITELPEDELKRIEQALPMSLAGAAAIAEMWLEKEDKRAGCTNIVTSNGPMEHRVLMQTVKWLASSIASDLRRALIAKDPLRFPSATLERRNKGIRIWGPAELRAVWILIRERYWETQDGIVDRAKFARWFPLRTEGSVFNKRKELKTMGQRLGLLLPDP